MDFIKFFGAIMVVFIFIAGGLYYLSANISEGNIEETDDIKNQTSFLTIVEDKLNSTHDPIEEQYDQLTKKGEKVNLLDVIGFLVNAGYKALMQVVGIFGVINPVITMATGQMQIPPFVSAAIFTMILATITITIIYMLFRFQPRN